MTMRSADKKRTACLAAGLTAMMLGCTAYAEGPHHHKGMGKGHKPPTFEEVDVDADGAIVAEEFYAMRSKRMAERAKAGGKMKHAADAPVFEDIDTDGDGKVTAEEFAAHQAERMASRRAKK